jgi:predicted amidohydrolase
MPLIAALEVPHRFGEVAAQLAYVEASLPDAALVVLPETCLTGYVGPGGNSDLTPFAEPRGGATEESLRALAKRSGRALLAPLIERAGQRCYNAVLFIDERGEVLAHYRKRHPWLLEEWAAPGDLAYPLVTWSGLQLAIAICFDAQFLLAERPPALTACDALLFPSAWTEFPPETREALLASISRQFGCAVVNANWGKGHPRVLGQGRALILDSEGGLISEGSAPTAELSKKRKR